MATGIRPRHSRSCRSRDGGRCNYLLKHRPPTSGGSVEQLWLLDHLPPEVQDVLLSLAEGAEWSCTALRAQLHQEAEAA